MTKGVRDQTVKDSGASTFKAACLQKSDIHLIFRISKAQDVRVACFVPAPFMPPLIYRESGQTEEETNYFKQTHTYHADS